MIFFRKILLAVVALICTISLYEVEASADYLNDFSNTQTKASILVDYDSVEYNEDYPNGKYDISSIDIRFGAIINKELYDDLVSVYEDIKFGVGASKTSVMIKENKSLIDYAHTATFYTCKPKRVDINGNKDDNGDYYLITISITNIKINQIDSEITAGCFIYVGDDVYLMKECTQSVRSLSNIYLRDYSEEISEVKGVLEYINNYI